MIRPVSSADAFALARIYNHYIATTTISFETEPANTADMIERIAEVAATGLPWLVIETRGQVLGYAYTSKWKGRCAYRFSVETSVYLDTSVIAQGLGSLLYTALIARLSEIGIHAAIGGVALPNPASVALHEKFGFEKVAHFKEVGSKFDRWRDVGYWQLALA
ncbi:MAG: N-acetyltransferase family protein [Burkholderiales bacterium]|nr:N-acetyltransferase family protein [Burkholderiales bacterium]